MPFLHWGKQEILRWRKEKITTVEENQNKPIAKQKPVCDPKDSTMRRFYADLMQRQLFCDPPLHIRRTLDQYYYTHMRDTSARDNDQVVSKYGKGGKLEGSPETNHKTSAVMRHGGRCTWLRTQEKDGGLGEGNEEGQNHTILMVDQLWLWILGSGKFDSLLDSVAPAKSTCVHRNRSNLLRSPMGGACKRACKRLRQCGLETDEKWASAPHQVRL